MVYVEPFTPEVLKSCFRFYKHLHYDTVVLNAMDDVLSTTFSRTNVSFRSDWSGASTVSSDFIVYALPSEGFFLLRGLLTHDTVHQLLLSSVFEWTQADSRISNIDPPCCVSGDLWLPSLKEVASGKTWEQTVMGKLRWITFGYHYQWSNRRYEESLRGNIPDVLGQVTTDVVNSLLLELTNGSLVDVDGAPELAEACIGFHPEAAIINYYRAKTTMGFHADDAEFARKSPLVSIRWVSITFAMLVLLWFSLTYSV
ncbi:unnamed protein product [Dicrocoelium dendriticum]|nr:unnamed protein product [Dicrocoelium dendriticum]